MLGFFDHGLFELGAVAVAFLIGRKFMLRRLVAVLAGGFSVAAPIVLFFLAQNELQTWLLAALLASSMVNVALIVELAAGRRFHGAEQAAAAPLEAPRET